MTGEDSRAYAPHCDDRILHAPYECEHCDKYPDRQIKRLQNRVAFTGHEPRPGQYPCPADTARPPRSSADHRRWAGNKPTSATGDPSWPAETFASQVMYGDHGGRQPWPLAERTRLRLKWYLRTLRKGGRHE